MSEPASADLKQRVVDYLKSAGKAKNRDVAKALGEDKKLVDKAIGELGNEGKLEYLYLDGSYVKLKE
jgi:Mn-dependent DtxR family transcriptional regulator